jgi:hypothetical protein
MIESIVIVRDGKSVVAAQRRGGLVEKSEKVACEDFETGAKPAFDRLMGREEPSACKYGYLAFNGRCMASDGSIQHVAPFQCSREKCKAHRDYKEPQPAPKFKVGDRVVHKFIGLVTIKEFLLFKNEYFYHASFDPDASLYWLAESEISPAPEPKYYTGRVVCTKCKSVCFGSMFPIGSVHAFKDGKIVSGLVGAPRRVEYITDALLKVASLDDLNLRLCGDIKFAEVEE